jgi:hypothetical protein
LMNRVPSGVIFRAAPNGPAETPATAPAATRG